MPEPYSGPVLERVGHAQLHKEGLEHQVGEADCRQEAFPVGADASLLVVAGPGRVEVDGKLPPDGGRPQQPRHVLTHQLTGLLHVLVVELVQGRHTGHPDGLHAALQGVGDCRGAAGRPAVDHVVVFRFRETTGSVQRYLAGAGELH